MSDEELIARLHLPWPKDANVGEVTLPTWVLALTAEAADRIEELEAKLAKAVDALVSLEKQSSITSSRGAARGPHWTQLSISILNARTTLAELKGEKL